MSLPRRPSVPGPVHAQAHPLAGRRVRLSAAASDRPGGALVPGAEVDVEDWWDRGYGSSWMDANGNPAAMTYGMRSGFAHLPTDDEVVYVHDRHRLGHLVHVSELGEVVEA